MSERSFQRSRQQVGLRWITALLSLVVLAVLLCGTTVPAEGQDSDSSQIEFGNETYRVDPPETAEIELNAASGGVYTVIIDAPGDQFNVQVTVGYPQQYASTEGKEPAILLETGAVSASDPRQYLSVTNATIQRITIRANSIENGSLPGGQYDLRVIDGQTRSEATLAVTPTVTFNFASALNRSTLERDPIQTITGTTDLSAGQRVQIRVSSTGQESFLLENETVVDEHGQFETAIDLGPAPAGTNIVVSAHHDGIVRERRVIRLYDDLPTPTNGTQTSNGITFAYEGTQLQLETAQNQTISGETTLEEGALLTLILRTPESHLSVTTTEVERHGTFEVRMDLAHLQPQKEVVISVVSEGGATGVAPVVLTAPSDDRSRAETASTGNVRLDAAGSVEDTTQAGPYLFSGLLAILLGIALAVIAGSYLLGIDLAPGSR